MSPCVRAKPLSWICNSFALKCIKMKTINTVNLYLSWVILLNTNIRYGTTKCNIEIRQRSWKKAVFKATSTI